MTTRALPAPGGLADHPRSFIRGDPMSARPPQPRSQEEALAEAERRISECRRTRDTVLDLDNLGLAQLPESLASLSWLQDLRAEDNDLVDLPSWLGNLTA